MDSVDKERLMNPPRTHTRASALANTYVNDDTKSATIGIPDGKS